MNADEFWFDRYETQHRTLHACEDALAETRRDLAICRAALERIRDAGPSWPLSWSVADGALAKTEEQRGD